MRTRRSTTVAKAADHLRWRRRRVKSVVSARAARLARAIAPKPALTFRLGSHGRLGNQLFQIAGTIGIAEKLAVEAVFPGVWGYRPYFSLPDELYAGRVAVARCEEAWPLAVEIDPRARVYLQDLSLWDGTHEAIRRWLQPSELARDAAARQCPDLLALPSKTAVHVRRGDYLTDGSHRPCPPGYYEQAVAAVRADDPATQLLIFSDDIAWCRRKLPFREAHYVEGYPDWLDLTVMTQCEHHICANSTFSWWGAFLSTDRSPIVPWLVGVPWPLRMRHPPGWREIEIEP